MPRLACSEKPPFSRVGYSAGELDVLQPAGDFAHGVGQRLAVLERENLGDSLAIGVHQLAQLEHDLRAARQGRGPPCAERLLATATA